MAEDIDDLLDEVETKFCVKDKKHQKKKSSHLRKSGDPDIDDILEDIKIDPEPLRGSKAAVCNGSTKQRPDSAKKCYPVFLGGSMCAQGMANSINSKTCDRLRCTSCDFKVCSFDNFEWDSSTDYLFLRNNAPDFHRLKSNLVPKKGYRAYCCQCSFKSEKDITKISDPKLKWVCGKHL